MERGKFLGALRNLTAAAAVIPFSVSPSHVSWEQMNIFSGTEVTEQQLRQSENNSFLDRLDQYLETDYGKAIAVSLFVFSAASAFYRIQKSWEQDSNRKFGEAVSSSVFFLLTSLNLLAQTQTDLDPKITASMLNAFSLTNSIYIIESTIESDRKLRKRLPAFLTAASLLALSSIISADTVKNS